ncbi:short-chain dehydrogenase reductase 3b-like [Nicotiana tabacum]|uniref:Short-chain dehydrogenase reductase 3b-like n=1 Tax=Nicotiana tabacum TaxID=4097 RepID=A0A1S4BXI1_TOBAC|nr:PREDICTED: short-chain dehydrogenase reductase 3b-like [Nicotiana tabacum]
MANKLRLEGKVAVITGAASGIGEATARLFVEHGARVVIADIQDELGLQVVASIGTDKASYRHCDVTDEKQVEETVAYAVEKYGTLDIMFSNVGTLNFCSVLDMDMTAFDKTMAVNVRGTALAVKHAARVMVAKQVRGSIICNASIESILAGAASLAYVASKHAVVGIVKAAARELGLHGVRVNGVSPYGIATPLVCKAYGCDDAASLEAGISGNGHLKGVTLSTEHIAQAALFLASDESAYISGHNLAVDGGLSSMLKLNY